MSAREGEFSVEEKARKRIIRKIVCISLEIPVLSVGIRKLKIWIGKGQERKRGF